jgi:hypothetical protein
LQRRPPWPHVALEVDTKTKKTKRNQTKKIGKRKRRKRKRRFLGAQSARGCSPSQTT